jgi:hypothetical protein
MSNFYLMPTASFTGMNGNQFTAPKYFQTDLAGLSLSCVPYGAEKWTLVNLASPNAALQAEPDVFSFPVDLTTLLQPADVAALDIFCAPANIPSTFAIAGMTFAEVLRQISQIHLLAQFLSGKTAGKSIFPSGVTLGTKYQSLPVGSALSPAAVSVGVNSGLFDFSGVQSADTVGNILTAVSQQFTQPVDFNGAAVIPSRPAVVSTGVTI